MVLSEPTSTKRPRCNDVGRQFRLDNLTATYQHSHWSNNLHIFGSGIGPRRAFLRGREERARIVLLWAKLRYRLSAGLRYSQGYD